jgi:hypothetical protein
MEQASSKEARPREVREKEEQTDAARRELLTTIGRFIYVAPALALLAQPKASQAGYGAGGTRPGYGYGDPNHIHTGPPGLNK